MLNTQVRQTHHEGKHEVWTCGLFQFQVREDENNDPRYINMRIASDEMDNTSTGRLIDGRRWHWVGWCVGEDRWAKSHDEAALHRAHQKAQTSALISAIKACPDFKDRLELHPVEEMHYISIARSEINEMTRKIFETDSAYANRSRSRVQFLREHIARTAPRLERLTRFVPKDDQPDIPDLYFPSETEIWSAAAHKTRMAHAMRAGIARKSKVDFSKTDASFRSFEVKMREPAKGDNADYLVFYIASPEISTVRMTYSSKGLPLTHTRSTPVKVWHPVTWGIEQARWVRTHPKTIIGRAHTHEEMEDLACALSLDPRYAELMGINPELELAQREQATIDYNTRTQRILDSGDKLPADYVSELYEQQGLIQALKDALPFAAGAPDILIPEYAKPDW